MSIESLLMQMLVVTFSVCWMRRPMTLQGASHAVSKAEATATVATYSWLGWAVHIASLTTTHSGLRHLSTRHSPGGAHM